MKQEPKQHVELINDNIEEFDKAIKLFKQETLKEAAKKYPLINQRIGFIEGAKWQQERSYSEEEVLKLLLNCPTNTEKETIEWFEQFKKK